jgi:hypothetical protein
MLPLTALRSISFDSPTLDLMREALRSSFGDEQRHHADAVARLQAACVKLQKRIDQMYIDKLDGVIDADFFERQSASWWQALRSLREQIVVHESANHSYQDEGVMLLELAHEAPRLFEAQPAPEQRKLLEFMVSNSTFAHGKLRVEWRKPFDLLAKSGESPNEEGPTSEGSEGAPSYLVLPTGFEPVS